MYILRKRYVFEAIDASIVADLMLNAKIDWSSIANYTYFSSTYNDICMGVGKSAALKEVCIDQEHLYCPYVDNKNRYRYEYLSIDKDILDEEYGKPLDKVYTIGFANKQSRYSNSTPNNSTDSTPNNSTDNMPTGGNSMANVNETFKTVMSMKMLSGIMNKKDQDLGKLLLMQSMMNGEQLKVTDVIKSKLISQFGLDDNTKELPVEKMLLLQMLDGGSVDMSQLIAFKMMGSLFDDKETVLSQEDW